MRPQHFIPLLLLAFGLAACSGAARKPKADPAPAPARAPEPKGPQRLVLTDAPIHFQDQAEPFLTEKVFSFELPLRPRRARLKLRYTGVPGATSQDYTMGRFRHRVELNGAFLMDLNTHSDGEDHGVEYTKWISVGMFKRHNALKFTAGDDGARQGRPDRDEYELRSAILEFDW